MSPDESNSLTKFSSCDKQQDSETALSRCARCRTVAYCSKDCQATHWPFHKPDWKRPNHVLEAQVCPGDITDPFVKRVLSCLARATFSEVHRALQVAFGWTSTHDWDFAVRDPAYTGLPEGESEVEMMMRKIQRHNSRHSGGGGMDDEDAREPREFMLRIKAPRADPNMAMQFVDSRFGDIQRAHPRTLEKHANKVKLFEVFDKEEYRDQEYAYTYDFGDR